MSSVMKPVGPEDPQVYWRRRAVVIGLVLVVLLVLFLIFRPKGGEEPQAEPLPASPSPTVTTTASPTPTGTGSPSPSPTETGGVCPDTDIEVTVAANQQTYPAGEDPEITMTIGNTGTVACQRDVGAGANEIVISSAAGQVWSSDDCSPSTETNVQTLEPGKQATVTVTWPRTRSSAGCPTDQPPVPAGAYEVVGRNDKVRSEEATITLQ